MENLDELTKWSEQSNKKKKTKNYYLISISVIALVAITTIGYKYFYNIQPSNVVESKPKKKRKPVIVEKDE